uniref:Uncharacterized protein n=1 Tax=Rhizophora mucronata TaxID=61149 RepID=A0A2P2NRP2_RHIMU
MKYRMISYFGISNPTTADNWCNPIDLDLNRQS